MLNIYISSLFHIIYLYMHVLKMIAASCQKNAILSLNTTHNVHIWFFSSTSILIIRRCDTQTVQVSHLQMWYFIYTLYNANSKEHECVCVCVCKSFLCYVFFSVCLFLKCARKTKITSFFIFYQIMVFKWIFVNLNTWFYFLQDQLPSSSCKHSLRRKSEANEHKLKSHVIIYQVLCQTKEK